jgi:hypothetical protein
MPPPSASRSGRPSSPQRIGDVQAIVDPPSDEIIEGFSKMSQRLGPRGSISGDARELGDPDHEVPLTSVFAGLPQALIRLPTIVSQVSTHNP